MSSTNNFKGFHSEWVNCHSIHKKRGYQPVYDRCPEAEVFQSIKMKEKSCEVLLEKILVMFKSGDSKILILFLSGLSVYDTFYILPEGYPNRFYLILLHIEN